jgi:hypothetical protein
MLVLQVRQRAVHGFPRTGFAVVFARQAQFLLSLGECSARTVNGRSTEFLIIHEPLVCRSCW